MGSPFVSTADGIDICLHRLCVNGSLLRSTYSSCFKTFDAEHTIIPEGAPCCVLFRTTGDLPAGAPHRSNKSNKLRSAQGRGEMFLPAAEG